jgi:hypothetical protein
MMAAGLCRGGQTVSNNGKADGWIDGNAFNTNRNNVPLCELKKYAGQWVAWSADGTRIVASHPDMLTLCDIVDRAGLKPFEVVYSEIHADVELTVTSLYPGT